MGDESDLSLPLFDGPHVPRIRFEGTLERLDVRAAVADAPQEWRPMVEELAGAIEHSRRPGGTADIRRLLGMHRSGWPALLERTWQRLVGRCLDRRGTPQVFGGEPAAAYLLRGGERERALHSIRRHLKHHPRDARGWAILAEFEPVRGAARCGFHGGPVLDCVGDLIDMVQEDEISPVGPWLLTYGWFTEAITLAEIACALSAEGTSSRPPLPMPRDAHAFAWYLVEAGGRRLGARGVGVIEARKRLQRICPAAFRRYLARVERSAGPA